MNEQLFQLAVLVGNGLACLAFWALKREVSHVKELLNTKIDADKEETDRRLSWVESKCRDCPSHH